MQLKWGFMKTKIALAAATGLAMGTMTSGAQAAVVFSDDFNSYAYQLNWVPPSNWSAPGPGTVDLIGQTTTQTNYNFFPGNGGYVDLNGSNGLPGSIQTLMSFAPGTYTLSFDLGGNARGDIDKTTTITLGDFSQSITLGSGSALQLYTYTFTTTGGVLNFADLAGGNGDVGNILDNVTLTSGMTSAVPEPSTWAMMIMGFFGVGFLAYRRSNRPVLRLV
jgi:hypothetical protein